MAFLVQNTQGQRDQCQDLQLHAYLLFAPKNKNPALWCDKKLRSGQYNQLWIL